jgi:hypothetical protein
MCMGQVVSTITMMHKHQLYVAKLKLGVMTPVFVAVKRNIKNAVLNKILSSILK